MKIVRILVYEGSEEAIKLHIAQTFVGPDRPFARPRAAHHDLTIHEIFRGSMLDVVEHLDEGGFVEETEKELPDSIPDLRLDEETAP